MNDRFHGTLDDVSKLGITTWSLGKFEWRRDTQPRDVLGSCRDYSINLLDTSPLYAEGRSEEIVGDFLDNEDARESFFLTSKGGLKERGDQEFRVPENYEGLRDQIRGSLRRLGTDRLDLFLLYGVEEIIPDPASDWLGRLRKEDLTRYVGLFQGSGFSAAEELIDAVDFFVRPGSPLDCLDGDSSPVDGSCRTVGYDPFFGGLFDQQYAEVDSEVLDYEVRRHHPKFSSDRVEYLSTLKTLLQTFRENMGQDVRLETLILSWLRKVGPDDHLLIGMRNVDAVHLATNVLNRDLGEEDLNLIKSTLEDVSGRKGRPDFLNPPPVLPRHFFERHVLPL